MLRMSAAARDPLNDTGLSLSLGVPGLPSAKRETAMRARATAKATPYTLRLGRVDLLGRAASYQTRLAAPGHGRDEAVSSLIGILDPQYPRRSQSGRQSTGMRAERGYRFLEGRE